MNTEKRYPIRYSKEYRNQYSDGNKIYYWTIKEILEEINRDRSDEWTDYDETDWQEGLEEFTEFELVDPTTIEVKDK